MTAARQRRWHDATAAALRARAASLGADLDRLAVLIDCDLGAPAWPDGYPVHTDAFGALDPDGRVAMTRPESDGVARVSSDGGEFHARLRRATDARDQLDRAWTAFVHALDAVEGIAPRPRTPVDEEWCESCLRAQIIEPRDARYRGLCRFCWRFRNEHGVVPPIAILRARHEGKRLNERMIAEALRGARTKGV